MSVGNLHAISTQPEALRSMATKRVSPIANSFIEHHILRSIAPQYCSLIITEQCNSRCEGCSYHSIKPYREMSKTSFSDILCVVDTIPTLRSVHITGGEPLLHPHVFPFADDLRTRGLRVMLNTNGLLLKGCADAVARTFNEVWVSLDSDNRSVMDQINRRPVFDLVCSGVGVLRRQKVRPRLIGNFTIQKRNVRDVFATYLFAQRLGLDAMHYQAIDIYSQAFGRRCGGGGRTDLGLDVEDEVILREQLSKLKNARGRIAKMNTEEDFATMERFLCHGSRMPLRRSGGAPCRLPWKSFVVNVDGHFQPCFWIANSALASDRFSGVLGSIAQQRRPECQFCPQCG